MPASPSKPRNRARAVTLTPTFDQLIARIPNRGHSLTIDSGWREVAQTALDFVKRFVQ
jgi:hypothetical protein